MCEEEKSQDALHDDILKKNWPFRSKLEVDKTGTFF